MVFTVHCVLWGRRSLYALGILILNALGIASPLCTYGKRFPLHLLGVKKVSAPIIRIRESVLWQEHGIFPMKEAVDIQEPDLAVIVLAERYAAVYLENVV